MSVKLTNETMKVYMEKRKFVEKLSALFEEGSLLDVQKMEYAPVLDGELDGEMEVISEKVTVTFRNGLRTEINVTADSTLEIVRDVLRRLSR